MPIFFGLNIFTPIFWSGYLNAIFWSEYFHANFLVRISSLQNFDLNISTPIFWSQYF
jgi:hypothetical protein